MGISYTVEDFIFFDRQKELVTVENYINNSRAVILKSIDSSGLSYFLKKITIDTTRENDYCFYISSDLELNIQDQIVNSIIDTPTEKRLNAEIIKSKKKDVIISIIKPLLHAVDLVFMTPSLGSLAGELIDGINNTLDVDIKHANDYKIEKALNYMIKKLEAKKKKVILIIDKPCKFQKASLEFLSKIIKHTNVYVLYAFSQINEKEIPPFISRVFDNHNQKIVEIKQPFLRPNNDLINKLFNHHGKEFNNNALDILVSYDRNIHVIMAFLHGYDLDYKNISNDQKDILKILIVSKITLNRNILKKIYDKYLIRGMNISSRKFDTIFDELERKGFIEVNNGNVRHNKNIINIVITNLDKIIITNDILDIVSIEKSTINSQLLEFAINNSENDHLRRKSFVIKLIHQKKIN